MARAAHSRFAARRLACDYERRRGRQLTYKAGGVDAIFPRSAFERRFPDIHTLSQKIQPRDAHNETVRQVLLGNPPEAFF